MASSAAPVAPAPVSSTALNSESTAAGNSAVPANGAGVPQVQSTPTVISSEDNNTEFANNSSKLAGITGSPVPTGGAQGTPLPQNTSVTTVTLANGSQAQYNQGTGAMTDMNGNPLTWQNGSWQPAPGTSTTGGGGTGTSTGTEVEGAAGSGSTGDPLYDSWNASLQAGQQQIAQQAQSTISQFNSLYQSQLMQDNETYTNAVSQAQSTFAQAIAVQTQINNQSLARVQAYGLGSGSALTMPLEFSNAITVNMQNGAAAIQSLNDKLAQAIADAQAAKDSADNSALTANLNSIDKIQTDMNTQMANVEKEAQDQLTNLRAIQTQQQAQLQKDQTAYIAAAWGDYGDKYASATDNATKDALIKQVINTPGSGLTMADYNTVFTQFESNAATQVKNAQTAALDTSTINKNTASIAASAASVNSSNATAAKTWEEVASGGSLPTSTEKISQNVAQGVQQLKGLKDSTGAPYIDNNGYFTAKGFQEAVSAAGEEGMSRTDFLTNYGYMLYPGSDSSGKGLTGQNATYENYGLTNAEVNKLKDASAGT